MDPDDISVIPDAHYNKENSIDTNFADVKYDQKGINPSSSIVVTSIISACDMHVIHLLHVIVQYLMRKV